MPAADQKSPEEPAEPSLAWQAFDFMRSDIIKCRSEMERNDILGLPTEPDVRRTASMKIPTYAEMMEAAATPDNPAPRTPNPAGVRALLQHIRTLNLPNNPY